ncbi:MAG: queuosine precursor transporter [Clostridiales bacterium]|jgi:uncharacterized integral membrane protein (TIGR00697 family)|nr:queuosine precursor transporter [Clostridiales bacterium]
MNEALFFATVIVYFSMLLAAYKIFGKTGIFVWTAVSGILCNLEVIKMVDIFGMNVTLGNVLYSTTFLATDILTEKYGKQAAKEAVWIGFFASAALIIITQFAVAFQPNSLDSAHESLRQIFLTTPRIVMASTVTYLVSQNFDIFVFSAIRRATGGKLLWLRNNVATLAAQLVDTAVFTLLAFFGAISHSAALNLILTSYALKIALSLLDTPFLYLAMKIRPRE